MHMINRNNYAIPVLMLITIPIVIMSYFLIKWAYSSGFIDWIYGALSDGISSLQIITIEILQKAFV